MISANFNIIFKNNISVHIDKGEDDIMIDMFKDNIQYEISIMYNNILSKVSSEWQSYCNKQLKRIPKFANWSNIIVNNINNIIINNGWEIQESKLNTDNDENILLLKCIYFDDIDTVFDDKQGLQLNLDPKNDYCI